MRLYGVAARLRVGLCVASVGILMLVLPGIAQAAAPQVNTFGVQSTGATTSTVQGDVNPQGLSTTYAASYDIATSTWCTSFGASGSPAHTTTAQSLSFTDSNSHFVSVDLSGLTAGTNYCAALTATNSSGTTVGSTTQFTQGVPAATTDDVVSTSGTTATVDGEVEPSGQATNYQVQYDLQSSTWCTSNTGSPAHTTTAQSLAATDGTFHNVSVALTGLTAGTQYCVQMIATNPSGSGTGGQIQFTAGAPFAQTFDAISSSATQAVVEGNVDPSGQTTTYQVQYDLASSVWCTAGTGSPAHTTAAQTLGATDTSFHDVSVNLSGLTGGTQYCAQLTAANTSATAVGGQVQFTAGVPTASTFDATSTGATTATVDGSVNPVGQSTTYVVQYDLNSSTWCQQDTGSPANTTTQQTLGFADNTAHDVAVNLTGLTAGTQYCAQLVATNASGSANGGQVTFTAGAPIASTNSASSTGATTATVDGSVNPSGQNTTYAAQYDLQSSTWCSTGGSSGSPSHTTTAQSLGLTDSTAHEVMVNLTGLTAGQPYCTQIVATNTSGSSSGGIVQFTAGVPQASTFDVNATGATTATVDGDVNPSAQSTTYAVQYDLQSSMWCASNGTSGSPGNTTTAQSLGFMDNTFHSVSVNLTGLTAGQAYCVQLIATNASGTGQGGQITFTAGSPVAVTNDAVSTGATTENIDGDVNPSTQSTTYAVQYDLQGSTWCTSGGQAGSPGHTTSSQALSFTDNSSHTVTVALSGLTSGNDYCAQLIATNSSGTSQGGFVSFSAGAPAVVTQAASSVSSTGATLNGTVNPEGNNTTYSFSWGPSSSTWCGTGGNAGSPANTTTSTSVGATDTTTHAVSAALSGLTPGASYCFQLTATNSAGATSGSILSFTATSGSTNTLTVVPAGNGSGTVTSSPSGINCGSTCQHSFATGTQVTLTAAASSGSTFTGWSGGGCSGTVTTCQVTLSTDTSVTATFTSNASGHTLTVTPAGSGSGSVSSSPSGISCGSTCSAAFPSGSTVTLTATPGSGSTFAGWSGGGCSGTGTCQVTMSSDQTVTATFTSSATANHTLTVTRGGSGFGGVSSDPSGISCGSACSASYVAGTVVRLTAAAAAGSTFAGWSGGGCSGTGTCVVTMSSDQTVTATFAKSIVVPPSCKLSIASASVVVKAKTKAKQGALDKLTLDYRCTEGATLTLRGTATIKSGAKKKLVNLGPVHGTSVANVAGSLTLKLPGAVIAALKAHKTVSVSFSLVAANANGTGRAGASSAHLRAG